MAAIPGGMKIDNFAAMGPAQGSHFPIDQRSKISRMRSASILPLLAVVVLWLVHLFNVVYDLELYRYGILPRTLHGLIGILTAPFIHGDVEHLFNNTLPVLFLGWGLMYFYPRIAGKVVLGAWVVANFLVWTSARQNLHIGASGVIYGMAGFLFTSGVLRRQRTLMALSLLIVFLYGSMVWGILPILPRISWEGHLWGMVTGIAMAYLFRQVPPAVSDPKPIHFDEEEEDEMDGDDRTGTVIDTDPGDEEQIDRPPPLRPGAPGPWHSTDTWRNGGPYER